MPRWSSRRTTGAAAGAAGRPGPDHRPVPGRRVLPGPGAGRARPGPRLRVRAPRRGRRHVHRAGPDDRRPSRSDISLAERLRLLRELGGPKLLLPRIPPPPQEVRVNRRWLSGQRHSKQRDATAISHHYDVSNTFYEWVLGPSMAYTCACYPRPGRHRWRRRRRTSTTWWPASSGLRPGMRLLDVGCGWGGMVLHAAREYGVKALGVTLSAQQAAWAQQAIEDAGPVRAGRGAPPGLPGRHRERLRRGQLDRADRAHRQGPAAGLLLVPATASSGRRAGCSTTASPGPTTRARPAWPAGSSTGTCSRTASWRAPATCCR